MCANDDISPTPECQDAAVLHAADFGRDAARPYRGPSLCDIGDQMVRTWVFMRDVGRGRWVCLFSRDEEYR